MRRGRVAGASPVVVGFVSGILFAVVLSAFQVLTHQVQFGVPVLVGGLTGGAVFGLVMGLFRARSLRASGGRDFERSVAVALKSGELPDGADTVAWSQVLDRRARQIQTGRWLNPIVFGLFTILGLYAALTISPGMWIVVALFAFILVSAPITAARQRRQIAALRAQLPTSERDN